MRRVYGTEDCLRVKPLIMYIGTPTVTVSKIKESDTFSYRLRNSIARALPHTHMHVEYFSLLCFTCCYTLLEAPSSSCPKNPTGESESYPFQLRTCKLIGSLAP